MLTRTKVLTYLSLAFITTFVFISPSFGFNNNVGTTGAHFLKIGVDARSIAMGEASIAVIDDVNAIYWNPAGLNGMEGTQLSFTHAEWLQGVNYEYFSCGRNFGSLGVVAFSLAYLSMGDMKLTKEDPLTGAYLEGEDSSFTATDTALCFGYANSFNKLLWGINVKMIRQVIEKEKARAFAFDLGAIYFIRDRIAAIGLVVQNIGPKIKFISEGHNLPTNFKFGCGFRLLNERLILALEVNKPIDNYVSGHIGGDFLLADFFSLRLGYKTTTINELGVLSGLSAGFGFEWQKFGINYAFVPYGDLGSTHRISLGAKF